MRRAIIIYFAALAIVAQPALAGIGRIKKVTGSVTVERGSEKLPVKSGMELEKGDTVVTGKGSRVGITFTDNSRFATGPNSRITITEFEFDDTTHAGQFLTNVEKGKIAIVSGEIARSAKDAMKVQTPSALLGVRGTKFIVEVN